MLDLRQLRYFVAVAETQNVGKAAERLGISQSPLSRRIKQLEARLDVNLFHREKQRVRLTNEGKAFLSEARELLSHARSIEQRAKRIGTSYKGNLVIGTVAGAVTGQLLPTHLHEFRRRYPDITIEVRIMRSAAQFEALKEHGIDIGYTHSATPRHDLSIVTHLLSDESVVLALPIDHVIGRSRTAVRAKALNGQPFISLPAAGNPIWHREFLDACRQSGFTPKIKYEVTDLSVALGLVQAGLGLAFVQSSLARIKYPGIVFRQVAWPLPRITFFCALRRSGLGIPAAAYARNILSIYGESALT